MKKLFLSSCGSALILAGVLGATPALADSTTPIVVNSTPAVTATSASTSSSSSSSSTSSSTAQPQLTSGLADEAKISKAQALSIASNFMKLPAGYKESNISFNTNWYPDQRSVWQMNWNKQADQATGNISMTVDATTGDVLAYNRYENNPGAPASYPPKVSQDQAVSIAKTFMAKQFPVKAKEVTYEAQSNQKPPLQGNVQYNLRFLRTVNNIPFDNNYITVTVDGNGTITGMDYRWDPSLTFPSPQGMLSQVQAQSILQKTLPFELQYITLEGINHPLPVTNPQQQSPKLVIAYTNLGNFTMLNAKTGNWIDFAGNVLQTPGSQALKPLADHPLVSPPSEGTEMTQSQAETKVKSQLDFPAGLVLENAGYNDKWGSDQSPVWNFNWGSKDHKTSLSATVDAKTGELLNFNYSNPDLYANPSKDWQPSVTYDQAKQTAIDSLKKWAPYKMNSLVFDAQNNPAPASNVKSHLYHFNFERVVNGIPVPSQSVDVSVSADTGKTVNFYQNWNSNVTFPDSKNVVPLSQAKGPYLSHFTFKPFYKLTQPNSGPGTMGSTKSIQPTLELVYQLTPNNTDQPVYFDANQNKWFSQRTGDAVNTNTKATDIAGSWAEKPLQLMLDYGAIQPDQNGKVHPNAPITRGQMIKMLLLATNPDPIYFEKMASSSNSQAFSDVSSSSPYYNYVQVAAQRGWVDTMSKDFNPNTTVTREDIADLIVHALNYEKLANVNGLFNLNFKDSGKITKKGDVAIVSHLGIMVGSNNYFHPQEKATKAQAAVAFYNFLKAQGKYGN